MDFTNITRADELLKSGHPHFGRIQKLGFIKIVLNLPGNTSRKAVAIDDFSTGQRQTVALHVDPENFMVTIAKSFVLVTLKDGAARTPVIQKHWELTAQTKGEGLTQFFGSTDSYLDSDGLKWEHRFLRETDEDELVGFGSKDEEVLAITLETLR